MVQELNIDETHPGVTLLAQSRQCVRHAAGVKAAHQPEAELTRDRGHFRRDIGANPVKTRRFDRPQLSLHGPFSFWRGIADHRPGGRTHDELGCGCVRFHRGMKKHENGY
jgi:hypothetical protein